MSSHFRPFSQLASTVFALVAAGHLLRVVFALEVVVGEVSVPPSVSVVAALIAGSLSLMVWRESRNG